jgi:hypothetical protein
MATTTSKRYLVLRSFLHSELQKTLKDEVFECHFQSIGDSNDCLPFHNNNNNNNTNENNNASWQLNLGIGCGEQIHNQLPLGSKLARLAFTKATFVFPMEESLNILASSDTPLTGLALLYGPNSKMSPHYDSPTQLGQKQEWLVMITIGKAVKFICNDDILTLSSGDALVMDSMAVLHGVQGILQDSCSIQLPLEGSRLGVLFWHARQNFDRTKNTSIDMEDDNVEGMNLLFLDKDDNDDDD